MTEGKDTLTLVERDRRYALVADRMAKVGLDVLILPASTARWEQTMADARYMTSIGGFGTETLAVFSPVYGITAYVFNRAGYWRGAQTWVSDVRDGRNRWAANVAERLGEWGFSRGRAGISGLSGLTRSPDGVVPHQTVTRLRENFPNVEFVDATELMNEVRAVKSDEEITVMEQAVAIAEAMAARVLMLKPGDSERTVYAHMTATLLIEGGELPAMLLLGTGPGVEHGTFVPGTRLLEAGDRIVGEIEGRYAGYSGQVIRPAVLGRARADDRAMHEAAVAVFTDVLATLSAGTTLAEVVAKYHQSATRHGGGGCEAQYPLMHARGLGDEVPVLLGAGDLERGAAIRLERGMAFVLKPRIRRDGMGGQVGDTVVVGEHGGRRLGRTTLDLIEVPWS
jgi:Xaa-Pro dipeptidase